MSKKLLGLLLGLLCCTSVSAGNFVVGASVGVATGGEDAASLDDQLAANGFIASANTSGDIRTAWKTFVAYRFDSNWGVDLAYIDLGEATLGFSGINDPIDDILAGIGDIHPRTAQGTKLSIAYQYEINKSMHIQTMIGLFDWDASYTLGGVTVGGGLVSRKVTQSGTDVTTGIGLVHKLTNEMTWHVDWDFYEIDSEPINVFSFSLSYKFNLKDII